MLVVDAVAVEAIAAAVDEQYIDKLREEYVGYKNATIKTMIKQLRSWFVITNSGKTAIKTAFLAPWADTPNAHVTAMMRPLTTVVVSRGERCVAGVGGVTCVALSSTCGMRCFRMLPRRSRWSRLVVLRCCVMRPF